MPAARRMRLDAKVTVKSAWGLLPADLGCLGYGGKSDPYCVVEIEGRGNLENSRAETTKLTKTLEPRWDEEFLLQGAMEGDSLIFSVYDHDVVGADDLLGRVEMPFRDWERGYDGELELEVENPKKGKGSFLEVETIAQEPPRDNVDAARVYVRVVKADNLRAADRSFIPGSKPSSDPYCVVSIPDERRPKSRFKTKVIMKNLYPEWDEEDEVPGYQEGDDLKFEVFDWDRLSADDKLAEITLKSEEFHPDGCEKTLHMKSTGVEEPTLTIRVEVDLPAPPEIVYTDPGEHMTLDMRWPVPFTLRCLETNRTHQLVAVTHIGRSSRLDNQKDLILKGPGNGDIGRLHASIKTWQDPKTSNWLLRVYDPKGGGGLGQGPGGGHTGGGTSINGEGIHEEVGAWVHPGDVLRFGVNELWTLERSRLFNRSQAAAKARLKAENYAVDDPTDVRDLLVPSGECVASLRRCVDWLDFVRVVLEWLQELDEPPCVDVIEIRDERARLTSRHQTTSLEDQERYDVKRIMKDVRMGTTIRLRLCNDPQLLAPILQYLEDHRLRLERTYKDRDPIPD